MRRTRASLRWPAPSVAEKSTEPSTSSPRAHPTSVGSARNDVAGFESVQAEVVADGLAMVAAAHAGDAALALDLASGTKVLCAVRQGPFWSERMGRSHPTAVLGPTSARGRRRWYVGRPIMVTANDAVNRLFNGDVGVAVDRDGRLQVAMREGQGVRWLALAQFDQIEEWWAMTIHKSQGSEFAHAVVVLPDPGSPILSRELLYTGVTRARTRLTVVGDEEAVRAAVGRPVARASGLAERLWGVPGADPERRSPRPTVVSIDAHRKEDSFLVPVAG